MLIQLHIKKKKEKKSTAQAHYILVLLVKTPCIPVSIPAQILVVHELPDVVSSVLCPLVKRPTAHPVSELVCWKHQSLQQQAYQMDSRGQKQASWRK